jgi:hypothetical protein
MAFSSSIAVSGSRNVPKSEPGLAQSDITGRMPGQSPMGHNGAAPAPEIAVEYGHLEHSIMVDVMSKGQWALGGMRSALTEVTLLAMRIALRPCANFLPRPYPPMTSGFLTGIYWRHLEKNPRIRVFMQSDKLCLRTGYTVATPVAPSST